MKIIITGSLGNISKPLTATLAGSGHDVTVVSKSAGRTAAIEELGAKAAIGSVEDQAFINKTFAGADIVYTMVPGNFGVADYRKYESGIGEVYAEGIRNAGIKKVVNLSSIGAELPSGTGPIAGLHDVENILNKLDGVDVKHLRAGFFYTNYYNDIPMIKNNKIIGSNYSAGSRLVLVHPNDIADAVAEEIQGNFSGKSVRYIVSDERVISEIVAVLGAAIGQPNLPWVKFTDEQSLEGMKSAGFPPQIAATYAEMGAAIDKGILVKYYMENKLKPTSKTKLETFAKEFASAYNK
ncbi:MAG: NAD(P)H-binding protein [Chitinophagaceae bacterium]